MASSSFTQSSFGISETQQSNFAANPPHPFDANQDGVVSALDALIIINQLGLPKAAGTNSSDFINSSVSLDANGDGVVSARDALAVINYLSTQSPVKSEAIVAAAVDQAFSSDIGSMLFDDETSLEEEVRLGGNLF